MAEQQVSWRRRAWLSIVDATYLLAAAGCFGLAIYSILKDRAGSAGVAATFAVAFLFVRHLPVIESFKVFSIEAKFARRVEEFDRLLSHIRSTAQVTSRLLYMQLAYLDRMTTMGWGRKREFIHQLDDYLDKLGVDRSFIDTAKRPLLNFASWDLYSIFVSSARVLSNRLRQQIAQAQHDITKGGPIKADDPEWHELQRQNLALLIPERKLPDMSGPTEYEEVSSLCQHVLEVVPWPPNEKETLQRIADEVSQLSRDCWDEGTVTPQAQSYIEAYSLRQDDRLKAIEAEA